ncbi:hypothetical protein O3M35_011677 [Rhynocoris fuscipes]|uniref:Uncharacterized protein n=1 Tax=Rhynocoris fuscipes TaxID=488301 RepID=A0AAW1CX51_9HEMI
MEFLKFGLIFLFVRLLECSRDRLTNSSGERVIFVYPNEIKVEEDLEQCSRNSVCGIYHVRKWFAPKMQRLCRCQNSECPALWSEDDVHLDNHSQLKICENITDLNICKENEIGLRLTESNEMKSYTDLKLDCNCQWPSYWQLSSHKANASYSYNEYTCSKWKRCERGEFCGHVRDDIHSMYIQCSCPKDNMCVSTDRTLRNASEAFYSGPMLRAYCTPLSTVTTSEPRN